MVNEEGMAQLRADAMRIIAEAAKLPLKDAAYALWRQKHRLDEGLLPPMTPEQVAKARAKPMEEFAKRYRFERDHAQDGPTFDRLKMAHPHASEADMKQAIVAAVKFEDELSENYEYRTGCFGESIDRALAKARRKHPGYLEDTYHQAGNWLVYMMK
jgi:hypothetical protein